MPVNLEISLDKDINDIRGFFSDLKFRALTVAARQALNRTATSTQSNAIKALRKRRNAKLKDLKGNKKSGGFVTVKKARGSNIANLEAEVIFSGIPLPLILFITGSRTPRRQTLPNSSRRARSFEIVKGKKSSRKGLFVQRAKRGPRAFTVFRRGDVKNVSEGFIHQSIPSVAELLRSKRNMLIKIENHALATLQRNYDSALKNQLSELKL